MREIRLYGHLGAQFGRIFHFDVKSPAEAVAALRANLKGFEQAVLKHNRPGYRVIVGKVQHGAEELHSLSKDLVIKIIPVVAGASAVGRIVIGAALITAGVLTGNPFLLQMGVSLVVGGIAELLFAPPKTKPQEKADNQPSYTFNGPVNTTVQGNPIPICYGQLIVGSQVIFLGLNVEQLEVGNSNNAPPLGQEAQTGSVINGFAGPRSVGLVLYWEFLLSGTDALKNSRRYRFTWSSPADGREMVTDATFDNISNGFIVPRSEISPEDLPTTGQSIGWREDVTSPWEIIF